jgi:hypothetical protein
MLVVILAHFFLICCFPAYYVDLIIFKYSKPIDKLVQIVKINGDV